MKLPGIILATSIFIAVPLIGGFAYWAYSFSLIWDNVDERSTEVSRIRFEFGSRSEPSFIDISDPDIVKYVISHFSDTRSGLGDNRISVCRIRLYDSSGVRTSTRTAWLYASTWSFHILTDSSKEYYEVFRFDKDIPERLAYAFSLIEERLEEYQHWATGPRLKAYIEEGNDRVRIER